MEIAFLEENHPYTGSELSSQFGHMTAGLLGDSAVAWVGPCEVQTDNLVDTEDVINNDIIFSESMVHFIIEVFHKDIFYGIWLQRFMTITVKDYIFERAKKVLTRKGDDLYSDGKKLNVSIATVSPVSTLVHFGVNVKTDNTPVKTLGLSELGIDEKTFATDLLEKIKSEVIEVDKASKKVFTV